MPSTRGARDQLFSHYADGPVEHPENGDESQNAIHHLIEGTEVIDMLTHFLPHAMHPWMTAASAVFGGPDTASGWNVPLDQMEPIPVGGYTPTGFPDPNESSSQLPTPEASYCPSDPMAR